MKRLTVAFLLAFGFVLSKTLFIVEEGKRGIVLRFSKVKRDLQQKVQVYEPGLHFKLPFIDIFKKLDARIQTMDSRTDRFVTAEKKDLLVDSYIKWRISDFGQYYLATGGGDQRQAQLLLKRKMSDRLRSEIGNRTIKDIVSGSRGELMEDARNSLNTGADGTAKLGIQVVDVRIKKINLPEEVSHSIYQRMRAERSAVAQEHRSQGKEQAEVRRAEIDRRVAVLMAEAERASRILRGEGDAAVAKLFIEAFGKNTDFYLFLRTLKAYQSSFGQQDWLILHPGSHFFRYLHAPEKAQ